MADPADGIGKPGDVLGFVEAEATPGDPVNVLATMDRYAHEHAFLMNVGPEKGKLLENEVGRAGSEARVLEFGLYCGYSAIMIARHLSGKGQLISVERDPESVAAASEIIAFTGLAERVKIIEGSSGNVIPTLTGSFDLVFLDHFKSFYEADLKALEACSLLRAGTIVFADNVGPSFNPEKYLQYVRTCGRYDSQYRESTIEYTEIPDAAEISIFRG